LLTNLIKGASFVSIGVIFSKVLSSIALFWIATVLTKEQLGIFSYTIGILGVFITIQNGGCEQLIIQRESNKNSSIYLYNSYALISNVIVFFFSLILLTFYSEINNEGFSATIAIAIALSLLSSHGLMAERTKLIENRQFIGMAYFDILNSFVQYFILIISIYIFTNENVYAVSYFSIFLLGVMYAIKNKNIKIISFKKYTVVLYRCRWMICTSFLTGMVLYFPYAIMGLMRDKATAGAFFFINQSIYALGVLMAKPISSVLMPLLNEQKKNNVDVKKIFERLTLKLGLAFSFGGLFFGYLIQELVIYIWSEKWESIAPAFSIATIALGMRLISSLYWGYSNYTANWSLRPKLLFVDILINSIFLYIFCDMVDDELLLFKSYYFSCAVSAILIQYLFSYIMKFDNKNLIFAQVIIVFGGCFVYF
jgi:O-antigen/teichoic acid export membrane protein